MSVNRFEDLDVWKESMRLVMDIYNKFRHCNDFGLRSQVQRAAVSIPSNIAEGYDRGSNREFIRFLHYARGSCAELRTQLYIAQEAGFVSKPEASRILEKTRHISASLTRLITVREEKF